NLLRGGLDLARDRPLLGWGSGSFQHEYRRQGHGSGRDATSASHTIPVTIAAEQGLLGLAVYILLLVLPFGGCWGARVGRRSGPRWPPGWLRSSCTRGSTPRSSRTR